MTENQDNEVELPHEVRDEEDVLDVDFNEEILSTTYEITSYGADYPVDGLVKRLDRGDIVVPSFDPAYGDDGEVRGFQRGFVWSRPQMDRFIESLLLGLPVPGIFLVRVEANIFLVLDGQQRLRTLQAYYNGVYGGKEFRLRQAQHPFTGHTYQDLDDEDRRRLDDSVIHATILRQEQPSGTQDAVYSIFERLNTGGSPLQPQEIRIALYAGPFLRLISELNTNRDWRSLYGRPSNRFKDHELILRVLALYEHADSYSRPLKGFLNHYLAENRSRQDETTKYMGELFRKATRLINENIGTRAFRPVRALNAAVLDAVMVGVMRRLDQGPIERTSGMQRAYDGLIRQSKFNAATTSSTSGEDSVSDRLLAATNAFASLR